MPEKKQEEEINQSLDLGVTFDSLELEDKEGVGEDLLLNDKSDDTKKEEIDTSKKEEEELDVNKEFDKLLNTNSEVPDSVAEKDEAIDKATDTDKKDKDSSGSFVAFAKMLQEQGLSDFDEEEYLKVVKEKGEAVAIFELLEKNAQEKADDFKDTLDDYSKEYVEFRNAGFSKKEASTLIGNQETINAITDEQISDNEKLQENIIIEVSKLRGISPEETQEQIQMLKDTDKLKDRSAQNLKALKIYYNDLAGKQLKAKQDNDKAQKDSDDNYFTTLKENINTSNEIIKDKKINQQTKDKVYNMIAKPIKLDDGSITNGIWAKRKENQQEFDKKLAYFIVNGLFDGDTKNLAIDARTKALTQMKKELSGNRNFSTGEALINNNSEKMVKSIDAMKEFLED